MKKGDVRLLCFSDFNEIAIFSHVFVDVSSNCGQYREKWELESPNHLWNLFFTA